MTLLAVNSLSKTFGGGGRKGAQSGVEAVVDVTFEVEAGEFLTIIGPSGCGKSTLLRLLAGLEQPDAGRIVLQGQPLPEMADRQGRFGYMPQRDTLLPWRTVLDNVVLGAELAGGGRDAARADARRLLPLFGLDGFENAWPSALSGGMRSTVRTARMPSISSGPWFSMMITPAESRAGADRVSRRAGSHELVVSASRAAIHGMPACDGRRCMTPRGWMKRERLRISENLLPRDNISVIVISDNII